MGSSSGAVEEQTRGLGLYPLLMGATGRSQAHRTEFLRSFWNMDEGYKPGDEKTNLEVFAVVLVENEGMKVIRQI